MNENDDYTHVQRRLCAVMAKSEWTSSRMRMQKTGEELRERRAKSHQTANKFLQELLDKRTDSDLIDDNGAVDRYHKFVKYKSALNDDTNSTLDEFDRRLRALNNNRRSQIKKLNNQNFDTIVNKTYRQLINDLSSATEIQNDNKDIHIEQEYDVKPSRILSSISAVPATSTPNDTNELITPTFHDDEIQDLSNVKSGNESPINSHINHIELLANEYQSLLLDKVETLNSSTSSLNDSFQQRLYTPKVRRSDDKEIIHLSSPLTSSKSSLLCSSSNVLSINHCFFPRSLLLHRKIPTNSTLKRQLPSIPCVKLSEENLIQHYQQFDKTQLYNLLDYLNNDSNSDSHIDFTHMLDELTLSTITIQDQIKQNLSIDNNNNNDIEEDILPNLFEQSLPSIQEKLFYTILTIDTDDDLKTIVLYTMTLSTIRISASILLPYSMLNGRRPLLKCSTQTHFKQIHSKQPKHTYQVTAIESSLKVKQLQQNDIILKINHQSVWGLTTDTITDILKQSIKPFTSCSLTIARLCQPFV